MEISFWFGKGDIPNEKIRLPPLEVHFGVGGCGQNEMVGGFGQEYDEGRISKPNQTEYWILNIEYWNTTVPPSYILFGGTVPPSYVLFGGTVPPNTFLPEKNLSKLLNSVVAKKERTSCA